MPTYKIERWDPIIPPGHTQPLPMIYVKIDDTLLKLAKENDYNVIVTISGTGKLYDTKPIPAVIDCSAYYPDFRPNFFNENNLAVFTLMCDWLGYGNLGNVCIHGFTGPDKVKVELKDFEVPKPLPFNNPEFYKKRSREEDESYKSSENDNLNNSQLSLIIIGLIVFLIAFILLSK
jgi:hypothetical protein